MKKGKYNYSGFTLVELLVAMMVSAIILSAVAALAFAMGSANDSSDDTSHKQAQLRQATLRVSELIRHCKLVVLTTDNGILLWQADDDKNNRINVNELVCIESGLSKDHLRVVRVNFPDNPVISLGELGPLLSSLLSGSVAEMSVTDLIPVCNDVQFFFDPPSNPPAPLQIKLVSISFNIFENGASHNYQITAGLRNWAGNLLSPEGGMVVIDDD